MDRVVILNTRLTELLAQTIHELVDYEISAILDELRTSHMTLAILQATKIGLTVNRMAKNKGLSEKTKERANYLVTEWKKLVTALPTTSTTNIVAAPSTNSHVPMDITPINIPTPADSLKRKLSSADGREREEEIIKKMKTSPTTSTITATTPSKSPPTASTPTPSKTSISSNSTTSIRPSNSVASNLTSPPASGSTVTPSPRVLVFESSPSPTIPPPYNPNLSYYRSLATSQARQLAAANTVVDSTSRKRTSGGLDSSVDDTFLMQTASSSGTNQPIQLCSLETMCCDYIMTYLDHPTFAHLGALPISCMVKILSKATAEQLLKYEQNNPRLLGETESLWKQLYKKTYPNQFDTDSSSTSNSTWKQRYLNQQRAKSDKFSAMSERLKQMQQTQAKEKKEVGIKTVNLQTAIKLENKGKKSGPVMLPVSKLQALKQETNKSSNLRFAFNKK